MTTEPDVEYWGPKLAKSILRDSLRLSRGESVIIEVWTRGLPWVDSFVLESRLIGAKPMVVYESDNAFWTAFEKVKPEEFGKLGAPESAALRATNAYVFFWGPADRTRYHSLPRSTQRKLEAWEDEWYKIAKEKKIRVCRVELTRATETLAKEYGIDYDDWRKELLEATVVDRAPMRRDGLKISERLLKGKRILISNPNGTRLELGLAGRRPYVDDGVVDEADLEVGYWDTNCPSGVVTVAVDESVADGILKSNRPARYGPGMGGTEGGTWEFKNGRLIRYSFDSGRQNFERRFRRAGKEKYKPAILSIGLNPKVKNAPLFEDQERGVVTVYVGSNQWLGGSNKGDYHTWLPLRGADLCVDNVPLLREGKIV